MLKIICDPPFHPDFSKDVHYISWTPFASYLEDLSGVKMLYNSYLDVFKIVNSELLLSPQDTTTLFTSIDLSSETTTLYPEKNITILPNCNVYSDEEILKQFNDCLEAQNTKIKAKNVIFDMSAYIYYNRHKEKYDNETYLQIIINAHNEMCIRCSENNQEPENWFVFYYNSFLSSYLGNYYNSISEDLRASKEDYEHLISKYF